MAREHVIKLLESQVIKLLESQVILSEAEGVSDQRIRNHKYYTMQPLGNEQKGRSQYVSPDVLDGVESAKSMFAETFFTGRDVVTFAPINEGDGMEAKKRTAYVNLQLELNNWHALFRDGWHDAFIAKRMVVHVDWKEKEETLQIPINNMSQEQLAMIVQIGNAKDVLLDVDTSKLQMTIDHQTQKPMYSGEMEVTVDRSYACISLIQPERFFRDPFATYIHESSFCTWEMEKARWELVNMGFDPEQIAGLRKNYKFRQNEEDFARKSHDQSNSQRGRTSVTPSQDMVCVYRTITWLTPGDFDNTGEVDDPKLYEIWWAHGEILYWKAKDGQEGEPAIKEMTEMSFFEWTEYKIAHAEHGMSIADVLAHTQRVQSVLKRLILDNQQMRNTTRYEAVYNAVKNPRDLIDNRIGGIIWSRQIGSVAPLATPELSPLTIQAIQVMEQDKEARSGMSALSKGMNPDAVRYQNAANMVEKLTTAGNRRVMKAARDFANTFLIPLSKYVYRLGARNDKRSHEVQMQGAFTTITPSSWPDSDVPMRAKPALTQEESIRFAQSLLTMHQTLLTDQDPATKIMYGAAQKHALLDDAFDGLGIADTSRYMLRPDSPEYVQQAQQQAQLAMQEKAKADQQMQLQSQLMQSDDKRRWTDTQARAVEASDKMMDRKMDNARATQELMWQQYVDQQELEIKRDEVEVKEKQAARPAPARPSRPAASPAH